MKPFNKNILLFVLVLLFLACGICRGYIDPLKKEVGKLLEGICCREQDSFSCFVAHADELSAKNLRYHDGMLDIDSVKKNLLGTRVAIKEGTAVIKAESGNLFKPAQGVYPEEITIYVNEARQIQSLAAKYDAKFLCCIAPEAGCYETAPENIQNHSKERLEAIVEGMSSQGIPCLDFNRVFQEQGLTEKELFFCTDPHWKPATGFEAYRAICKELHERYGFSIQEEYTRMEHFHVETYKKWFLGAYGKKTGRFFTWKGADDFDVIMPDFPTNFNETVSGRDQIRRGAFDETMLYKEFLKKDYYHVSNYRTYSGGDKHLQIIQNLLNPDGETVLVVRNSFACVVTPFLALQTKELHVIDNRNDSYVEGEAVDLESYIRTCRPDYVLILKVY